MKLSSIAAVSFVSVLLAGLISATAVQEKKGHEKNEPEKVGQEKKEMKAPALVSSETAEYKEVIPGVSRALISGDPEKGAYRAFTKFAPGTTHAMHSHPNEIWIVVLKGAYIHKNEKGEETRVGPGCSFHFAAGDKHVSSSDEKEGLVMFEESSSKFGLDYVDKVKKEEKKEEKEKK